MKLSMFQFQTGSIKRSLLRTRQRTRQVGFNSKLVRLKGEMEHWTDTELFASFNSKLVRLKEYAIKSIDTRWLFQFQTGSIKSRHGHRQVVRVQIGFNSKLVRLKGL